MTLGNFKLGDYPKAHVSIFDRSLDFKPLAFDFLQIAQPELGDGQLVGFNRAANQLAPNPYS